MQTKFFTSKLHISEKYRPAVSKALYILSPLISMSMAEMLNYSDAYRLPDLSDLLWNLLWYCAIYALAFAVCGKRSSTGAVSAAVLLFAGGFVNHYVMRFRSRMFLPSDILHVQTAANVASGYDYSPDAMLIAATLMAAVHIVLLLRFKPTKSMGKKLRVCVMSTVIAFVLLFFCTPLLPRLGIEAESGQGENRGFAFNFMVSLRYCILREPEAYSEELALDLQEEVIEQIEQEELLDPEKSPEPEVKPTNILVIMNESLADFSIFEKFSASEDPLEFIHSMEENTVSGSIYSPVHGGGTANVEYEVLTGNPCTFLPEGAIAYQNYIDSRTPSLAWLAKDSGFDTVAFHPFSSSSWNRTEAYDHLGFDKQLYEEDIQEPEYIQTYVSDACNYRELQRMTEENEGKLFVFNVTMQNHSGYGLDWDNLPHSITLPDELNTADPTAEQYFSLIDQSDAAFSHLIEYYKNCSEPTLIAMFGDHQPPLSAEFYDVLYGNEAEDRSRQEMLGQYITPFVIWANYDIDEHKDLSISANFFGALLAELTGLESSYYVEMMAEIYEELPVIHKYGFISAEGEYFEELEQLSESRQELIKEYEILAYYELFDREAEDEFYEPE